MWETGLVACIYPDENSDFALCDSNVFSRPSVNAHLGWRKLNNTSAYDRPI